MADVRLRRYDPRDADAVWALHEWAMRATGTDPDDIPGTEDLRNIETAYLDAGGEFFVGIAEGPSPNELADSFDGPVVAMGGFLPSESGHDDERSVPGAAELHRMRVAPPCQGQGYGRQLLTALESRADAADFEVVVATTARGQRRALDFYTTAGYRRVGTSSFGEYELVHFEKRLSEHG